jgi:plastocyanin
MLNETHSMGLKTMRLIYSKLTLLLALSVAMPVIAEAEDYILVIKDHRFEPSELVLPAGERVKLTIHNQDDSAEEFESKDLRREKIIAGNSTGNVWIGPLPAGEYTFVGEFHEETAQGKLIVK